MSKTRYVNTDFWTDTWVVDHLNPLDRYLFVYLFTNPHANIAGVYELSLRIMSFETGLEKEELLRMLKRLEPRVKYLDGWVVMKNGIKHQQYSNPKIKTGILLVLEALPSEVLQHVVYPKDWGQERPKGNNQTSLLDSPSIGYEELSHSNSNIKPNLKPKYKPNSNAPAAADTETGKTGLNKKRLLQGEADALWEDYKAICNEQFKGWYYKVFFMVGKDRVQILASQAKADGKDPVKLFAHLLQKESGVKDEIGLSK